MKYRDGMSKEDEEQLKKELDDLDRKYDAVLLIDAFESFVNERELLLYEEMWWNENQVKWNRP